MHYDKLKISARLEDFLDHISLRARLEHAGVERSFAAPVTYHEQPEGFPVEPFMRIGITEAQQLMDELWNCGIRPSEGSGSAGSLKATQNHLEDMRKISFDLLGVDK